MVGVSVGVYSRAWTSDARTDRVSESLALVEVEVKSGTEMYS